MKALLRLIPGYANIERSLQRALSDLKGAGEDRMLMQGKVQSLISEVQQLREERDKALEAERSAFKMVINVEFKIKYGFTPFPDAPSLPDVEVDMRPIEPNTVSARAVAEETRQQFTEDLKEFMKAGGRTQ